MSYGCFGCECKFSTIVELEDHCFDNHPENLNIPGYVQRLRAEIKELRASLTSATVPDTVEYWKSRAETAEKKVLTFHEEIVKLNAEYENLQRLTSATEGERDAKKLAKELVYSVRGW